MLHLHRLNVLVVEDRAEEAVALRTLLDFDGYKIRIATDGEVALHEVFSEVPDVMLLDLDLPKFDGLQVAAATRSVEWPLRPWLVAVTGHGERWVRERAAAAGIDLFLVKPVDPDKLRSVLHVVERRFNPSRSSHPRVNGVGHREG